MDHSASPRAGRVILGESDVSFYYLWLPKLPRLEEPRLPWLEEPLLWLEKPLLTDERVGADDEPLLLPSDERLPPKLP